MGAYLGDHPLRHDVDVLILRTTPFHLKAIASAPRFLYKINIVNASIGILLPESLHDGFRDVSPYSVPARGESPTELCEVFLLNVFSTYNPL